MAPPIGTSDWHLRLVPQFEARRRLLNRVDSEKLRSWGIEAEATWQASRGESRRFQPLWRVKAREEGRLRVVASRARTGSGHRSQAEATVNWAHILNALKDSETAEDRKLAR